MSKLRLAVLTFALASTVALLSVLVQHKGPELVQYGNLCGPTLDGPCYKPVLKGGFPFAYLYDSPGVSVEDQLAFFEDELRPGALALDIVVYFASILLGVLGVSRCWSALAHAAKRADA